MGVQLHELDDKPHRFIKERTCYYSSRWMGGRNRYTGPVKGPTWLRGRAHLHEDDFELHFLSAGELAYVVGDRSLALAAGQACLVPPGVRHGPAQGRFNQCTLWWLRFPQQYVWNHKDPNCGIRRAIDAAVEAGSFRVPTELEKSLEAFLACERRRGPLRFWWSRHYAQEALFHAVQAAFMGTKGLAEPMSPAIIKALRLLDARCDTNDPIAQIAERVGLSVRQFNERFKAETGSTPQAYRTLQRIRKAKELVAEGRQSLTQIAHELGFSSSQHFSTVFKRITGMTPRTYAQTADPAEDAGLV